MAQYSNLKAYIEEKIYENGTQAITGDILQDVLKVMTDDLGEFYQTGGVASPSTDPGTPDAKVIYFATEAGTYTNFGGITLAAGEVALLIFETSWTKETLNVLSAANGGVKTANLADGAVTTEKIAGGAVETAKIANNAVTSGKVADGAIGTAKIADGAIDADKIAANAVESTKIKNGAVTEGKINDGAVTADKVAANAVTTAKIADDAVTTAKLNDGAVTEDKIATDAVTSGKVKDGAIGTAKIAAGAVTHAKIGAGAVEESNIKDGAVTSDKIANGAVGSDQLAEGAFSAENLADGSVTTDKLADEAVTAEKIADGAVTAGKFANGSVTTIKLGSGAVTTEKIGDGMVTRQKLADSSVGTSKIIDGAVTGAKLQEGVRPVINVNALNEQSTAYGSAALARAAVPSALRILGLHVIYLLAGGWFEDEFIGSDVSGWGTASNWRAVGPVSVSQNSQTGHTEIHIGNNDYPIPSVDELEESSEYMDNFLSGYIDVETGQWKNIGTGARRYSVFPINVSTGEAIHIKGSADGKSVIACLSTYNPISDSDAGVLLIKDLSIGAEYNDVIPEGTKYIYVLRLSTTDRTPQEFTIGDVDILTYAKNNIFNLNKKFTDRLNADEVIIAGKTPLNTDSIAAGNKTLSAAGDILSQTTVNIKKGDRIRIDVSGKGTIWSSLTIYVDGTSSPGYNVLINDTIIAPFDISTLRLRVTATNFIAQGTVNYSITRYNFKDLQTKVEISTTFLSEIYRGYIGSGQWKDIDDGYRYYRIIDLRKLSGSITIKGNNVNGSVVCFLSSYTKPTSGTTTGIIDSETSVGAGVTSELTIPINAKYLYVLWFSGVDDRVPDILTCGTINLLADNLENITKLSEALKNVAPIQGHGILDENPETEVLPRLLNAIRPYRVYGSDPTKDCLCLLHCSDFHLQAENMARLTEFCDKYRAHIDDVLHTGDTFSLDLSQTLPSAWNGSWLNVIGNHDATLRIDDQYVIQPPISSYNKLLAPYISGWGVTQPADAAANGYCYYYKDYTDYRLIVIDNFMQGSSENNHWNATQKAWFETTLESARVAGLQVIVAVHYPPFLTTDVPSNPFDSLYSLTPSIVCNAEIPECVADFIANGGTFVCWLCGHTHYNKFGLASSTSYPGQLVIVVPTASMTGAVNYSDEARVSGTKTQDCFDIIAFDPVAKTIKMMRIGSEYDLNMRKKNVVSWDYNNNQLIYVD